MRAVGPYLVAGCVTLVATTLAAQDTVRVGADGPPKWGPNVRLVQEVAIGQLDGPQEYAGKGPDGEDRAVIYRIAFNDRP